MSKEYICCHDALDEFVDNLLRDSETLEFDDFKKAMIDKGFKHIFIDGDDKHSSHVFNWDSPKVQFVITKCHCGYVHYQEDMCPKCEPSWYPNHESHQLSVDLSTDFDDGLPF